MTELHAPTPSFVGKHWRGEYSLAQSFWQHGFLVVLIGAVLNRLALQLGAGASARVAAILWVLSTGVGLVSWLWFVRGVWMAASRRIAEGRGVGMARVARGVVILGCLGATGLYSVLVQDSGELWEVMRGVQPGSAPRIRISEDGKTAFYFGGIQDGSAALLRGELREHPGVTRIVLTSSGGWIEEGVRLAEVIRERELDTHVESGCLSACVIVFSAGKERTASRSARLGFHRPKSAFLEGAALKAKQAFRDAGLPSWIIERAYDTPHESMWYPGIDVLVEEGVVTELREVHVRSRVDEIFSLDEYRALLVTREPYRTIAELFPEEFEQITDTVWEASKEGASIAEARYELALEVQELVAASLPDASDQTLLSFHDLAIDQITHLEEVDVDACVRLLFLEEDPGPNFPWPPELVAREVELGAQALREAAAEEHLSDSPSMEDVDRAIEAIEAKLTEDQLRLHDEEDAWMEASKEEACSAGRAFQHAIRDLPPADRLMVLRYMMSED